MINYLKLIGIAVLSALSLGAYGYYRGKKIGEQRIRKAEAIADYERERRVNAEKTAEKYVNDVMRLESEKDEYKQRIEGAKGKPEGAGTLNRPIPDGLKKIGDVDE